jgi:hypothetical protein
MAHQEGRGFKLKQEDPILKVEIFGSPENPTNISAGNMRSQGLFLKLPAQT